MFDELITFQTSPLASTSD